MLAAKDAVQREKDELLREIRHLSSLCTCPSYISVGDLQNILFVLQGEATIHKKFTICFPRKGIDRD